eukprot:362424-Chlamydomonas_euryale.AAC.1
MHVSGRKTVAVSSVWVVIRRPGGRRSKLCPCSTLCAINFVRVSRMRVEAASSPNLFQRAANARPGSTRWTEADQRGCVCTQADEADVCAPRRMKRVHGPQ